MLRHHGLNLSEPMVFGLSEGLTFAYLPFLKLGGMPLIAYRSMPKSIIKTLTKNLKLTMKLETFSNQEKGEDRLDELLDEDQQEEIFDYFMESESDRIQDAMDEFNGEYDYEELRLMRIKFISQVAN